MVKDLLRYGIRYLAGIALFLLPLSLSWASVTILGSRIIYPSDVTSVDVQLKNNDAFPYVVQTWFDNGDIDADPQAVGTVPFLATPPVFRIQPKSGQIVRIVSSQNKALPQDRESVFWFNALQVPPANVSGDKKQNKMLVMLRTRIKLFYRPAKLGAPGNLAKKLQIKAVSDAKKGSGITVINPQPWFASISNLTTSVNGKTYTLKADMVAPLSEQTFWLPDNITIKRTNGTVKVTLVNDQGARISEQYHVTYP